MKASQLFLLAVPFLASLALILPKLPGCSDLFKPASVEDPTYQLAKDLYGIWEREGPYGDFLVLMTERANVALLEAAPNTTMSSLASVVKKSLILAQYDFKKSSSKALVHADPLDVWLTNNFDVIEKGNWMMLIRHVIDQHEAAQRDNSSEVPIYDIAFYDPGNLRFALKALMMTQILVANFVLVDGL